MKNINHEATSYSHSHSHSCLCLFVLDRQLNLLFKPPECIPKEE